MPETALPQGTQARRRRPPVRPGLAALLVTAVLAASTHAAPGPPELPDARVAWVRGERAYVAARDSLPLAPFARVRFAIKGRTLATGEVERSVDGGMAVVRITSGSLARARRLDRIRIVVEPAGAPGRLRIGYPSPRRTRLRYGCDRLLPASRGPYRNQGDGPGYRLIRTAGDHGGAPLPETLLVRSFDDPTDQEIALERGELDLAVFWPGELSAAMRENPRWRRHLSAPWHGAIGPVPAAPESTESEPASRFRDARDFGECPVLCEPRLLPAVEVLGASVFVDLFECAGPGPP